MKRNHFLGALIALLIPSVVLAQVIFPNRGGTGTSSAPTTGQVLVGQADGTYGPQPTSSLNIVASGGGGGGDLNQTDIDTEAEFEAIVTDVSDFFTNNDGALDDDDLSDDTLNSLSQTSLADPNADQIVFWDDSDTQFEFISTLTGLSISGNTLSLVTSGDWTGTLDGIEGAAFALDTDVDDLSGVTNAATARSNLSLVPGTDVQAYDSGLADIAGLAVTNGNFIVGNGTNWVAESGATARTSLGLGTLATLSSVDISDNTNLAGDSEIVLTGDTLSISSSIARDSELHSAVTIAAGLDYVTLSGQELTLGSITPDDVLSAGQTDEYCLSYEATGDTWEWKDCSGGGGGDSISIDGVAVVDPDFVSTGDIDFVDTTNTITANINSNTIVNADINSSAAIAYSKLNLAASIIETDLDADVAPTDGDFLQYDLTGTNFTWRDASEVRSDLGLVIGTNVQAYDADLTTYAGITPSANVQSLLGAADYAAMRTLLDLEAGTDFYSVSGANAAFQPLDTDLTAIAGLSSADSNFIVGSASGWVAESGATARTSLGLGSLATLSSINNSNWSGTDLSVANGGTGASTLTDGGILLGSGTGALTAMSVLANGAIVVGDGTTDPVALTAFTSATGDLIHEAGGLEADVSGYTNGLYGQISGVTTDIDTEAELYSALSDVTQFWEAGDTLSSGAISSGFGNIDIGSSNLDADGTITFAGLSDGLLQVSGGVLSGAASVTGGDIFADTITHADIADSDQASTICVYIEDPTADDDLKSIWANKTSNNFLLTEIWGESDQTVNFDLQVDDGTPADVNGTDISPAAGEAEDTTLSGDTTLAAGEELDLAITSVSGTPTWVSICWTGNWVD